MSYWDSSALVKLYLSEPESAVFDAIAKRPGMMRTSPLGRRVMERLGMKHDPAGDFDHPLLAA